MGESPQLKLRATAVGKSPQLTLPQRVRFLRSAAGRATRENFLRHGRGTRQEKIGDVARVAAAGATALIQSTTGNEAFASIPTLLLSSGLARAAWPTSLASTTRTTTSPVSASGCSDLIGKQVLGQELILAILVYPLIKKLRQQAGQYHDTMTNETRKTYLTPAQHHHQHHHNTHHHHQQRARHHHRMTTVVPHAALTDPTSIPVTPYGASAGLGRERTRSMAKGMRTGTDPVVNAFLGQLVPNRVLKSTWVKNPTGQVGTLAMLAAR